MSGSAVTPEDVRKRILNEPDLVLGDKDVLAALVEATDEARGANVIDLRGIAMQRLEHRLGRLEDTHRTVIAAAYENLAGTTQVQRAVLRLLEQDTFEGFLTSLETDLCDLLRVDRIKLVLESYQESDAPALRRVGSVLSIGEPGFVEDYMTHGREYTARPVTLREIAPGEAGLYGRKADRMMSEACIRLDLGDGRLPGMLAMGAETAEQFTPNQGTDLLSFFGGAFERILRRWLA